ncbi:MAG: 2,3,4,5-tetrahydropyridine-2,6-dicarboxylate N-succinyltransferase [Holosporales bacterium]|nr:2,3,4,5-tetrahydropyridine-2,6-dicarboxylate N-succinyltransferase [Holosporales bacterium]
MLHPSSNYIDAISALNKGKRRICSKIQNTWQVDEELKGEVSKYLSELQGQCMHGAYDKVPLKFDNWNADDFQAAQLRVVPGAVVRYGAFMEPGVVLMNCFVNIGAYIGAQTMIDSFATVGSCAQIGQRCHISAGAVIGGVLEPVAARPVIIEDECFVGAGASIVEGVLVRRGAVIAMGTRVGASTRVIDRQTGEVFYGEIPEGAVVVPGTYAWEGADDACGKADDACGKAEDAEHGKVEGAEGAEVAYENAKSAEVKAKGDAPRYKLAVQCAIIVRYGAKSQRTEINLKLRDDENKSKIEDC